MFEIKAIDTSLPLEYTDRFWLNLIDRVTVYEDSRLVSIVINSPLSAN